MPQEKETQAPITFTADQLTAMLRELRKPAEPTEDEKARKQGEIDRRRDLAQLEHTKNDNRKMDQEMCPHTRFEDGSSRMVYIPNGNYLICQYCQFILRPEEDVKTFNLHFGRQMQKTTY